MEVVDAQSLGPGILGNPRLCNTKLYVNMFDASEMECLSGVAGSVH